MSKTSSATDAREKARKLAAQQAKKSAKKSTRWVQLTVLGVVALIVAIVAVVMINSNRNKIPEAGPVPASANEYGGILVTKDGIVLGSSTKSSRDSKDLGKSEATYTNIEGKKTSMPLGVALADDSKKNGQPVRVTIFQDYNCVHCAQFESTYGDEIQKLVESGKITLEIRNLTFLDAESPTFYSARANNVAYSVANQVSPDKFLEFQKEIFSHQGTGGLSNEKLIEIASKYGADVKDDVANNTWRPFINTVTLESSSNGISGTPTIFADGELYNSSNTDFSQWINQKITAKSGNN